MKEQDEALSISNPRLLSASYFGVLAIIATIIIDTTLRALNFEYVIPLFKSLLLSTILAAFLGALFGERIVHAKKPYVARVFAWGFLMMMLAIPIYAFFLSISYKNNEVGVFANATGIEFFKLYLYTIFYSFILVGIWLGILAGLAAIYLRRYFVYYVLSTLNVERKSPKEKIVKPKTPQYGESTVSQNQAIDDREHPE